MAEGSADRLKGLAESSGLKLGPFVERMIAAYSDDSNLLQNDSKAGSWESVADELRGLIASQDVRLNALEVAVMSGLGGGDAKVRVSVSAAKLAPVETESDSPSHQADPLPLPVVDCNRKRSGLQLTSFLDQIICNCSRGQDRIS